MYRWNLLLAIACAPLAAASLPLMPYPASVATGSGRLAIDSNFRISVEGFSNARLDAAVRRSTDRVFRQTGLYRAGRTSQRPTLRVGCRAAGAEWPALGEDESYQLDVTGDGARLSAANVTGIQRGLATFVQLISPGADGFGVPAVHIEDRPRFPWRGLMLDVSRHWMPVEVVSATWTPWPR